MKELARLKSDRSNMLVGYGVVTGLAGTGDSYNSKLTKQSMSNLIENLGINIDPKDLRARNVAAVMIAASLPPFAQPGSNIDVTVSSMGDARSLLGGALVVTPLRGPDQRIYALAQGSLSIGGYRYDLNGNLVQKNHPTTGTIANGAIVEKAVANGPSGFDKKLTYVLNSPDITTISRVVQSINQKFGSNLAHVVGPGTFDVFPPREDSNALYQFMASIESIKVEPDSRARVVLNERTGTVVAGGDVTISPTTITQGDMIVSISTDYYVSQPNVFFGRNNLPNVRTQTVPDTEIGVKEDNGVMVNMPQDSNVAELVTALRKVNASSRDIITILQGLKAAGALHAELIIQ
ncbi:flagellar basal body P-ring protein FlgI [Microbulbifer sp. SAOS-129_SWC]|uniref:flagellar basal body P-ring protein FlgI n=1 Tax=Microbulbifer sp. SAOS-129_SWC TaxID=3145235 RepID=UPI0032174A22